MADPDSYGIKLAPIRDRLKTLDYFTDALDIQAGAEAISNEAPFVPPAVFVSIAGETYEPNRRATGAPLQRAIPTISTLFVVPAERADGGTSDEVEQARKAIFLLFRGWTPPGAEKPLEAVRYQVRLIADGMIWGEWQHRTAFHV